MKKSVSGAGAPAFASDNKPKNETDKTEPDKTEPDKTEPEARERRARFAKALTRSVFGRYYWDEKMEAELRQGLRRSKERRQQ